MKRNPKLFLAVIVLFSIAFGFWGRGWVEDWKIQRQFERALDSFSADSTSFTLSLSGCAENFSIDSSQLTFKQKQIVEQYVHSLQYEKFDDYLRGGEITVEYWPSNLQIFSAGAVSRLNCLENGRIYHCNCTSDQPDLYEKLYDILKEKP